MNDTSPDAERLLIEGYRTMTPENKIRQAVALSQMTWRKQPSPTWRSLTWRLALTRIRNQYNPSTKYEERLRLASLHIPRVTMIRLFKWDPEERGY